MKTKIIVASMIGFLMLGSSGAPADSNANSNDVKADRIRYQKLLREIKSVDAEYSRVLQQAVSETKKDGKASLETKSRLLALSDKRDRIVNRLTLLSLRHGWEVPLTNRSDVNASQVLDEKQRVFEPADEMVKQKFAEEARRIASSITLPIISIESEKEDVKEKKKWVIF